MTRASCSWLTLTLLGDVRIVAGQLLLASLDLLDSCPSVARSRAIDWSNCVSSGDRAAVAVGATSSGAA